jgi:hypothetical protein
MRSNRRKEGVGGWRWAWGRERGRGEGGGKSEMVKQKEFRRRFCQDVTCHTLKNGWMLERNRMHHLSLQQWGPPPLRKRETRAEEKEEKKKKQEEEHLCSTSGLSHGQSGQESARCSWSWRTMTCCHS